VPPRQRKRRVIARAARWLMRASPPTTRVAASNTRSRPPNSRRTGSEPGIIGLIVGHR
jgi:hypothetical protein